MRKLAALILALFFLIVPLQRASAQEFTFEKAYQDYVYMTDLYEKAHAEYLLAKAQYAQAQTLTSQSKVQVCGDYLSSCFADALGRRRKRR